MPSSVIQRRGGIAYADEALGERDRRGVLRRRVPSLPGQGEPQFGQVHTPRQRHAQRKLLCQVCAGPADHNEAGTLWLVTDYHNDWSNWPERMACSEQPVCLRCARISVKLCPGLQRHGHAAFRVAHSELAGVYGILYRPGPFRPIPTTDERIPFTDPDIRWTQASQLLRELHHCTTMTPLSQCRIAYVDLVPTCALKPAMKGPFGALCLDPPKNWLAGSCRE